MSESIAFVLAPKSRTLQRLGDAPHMSSTCLELLAPCTVLNELNERHSVRLPMERPLKIMLNERELVTLMTLGGAPEYLAVGYLLNQGHIEAASALEEVTVLPARGEARINSRPGARVRDTAKTPQPEGLACGLGTSLAGADLKALRPASISQAEILAILDYAQSHDAIHRAAGSVHSAILFDGAEALMAIEDVSRHNAVDTVRGFMAVHGIEGAAKRLFTTGRMTLELVLKTAKSGIPILISRNGTTAAGCELAAHLQMMIIGRASKARFNCYVGAERLCATPVAGLMSV